MKLTIETCATALNAAAMNRKAAIQLELAVGLGVFATNGGTNKEARALVVSAYATAGYRCTRIGEMDYKTVNRRVNASAALYEKLPISKWIGTLNDMDIIQAICEGLAPYELYSIQDVLRFAAPDRQPQQRAAIIVKPDSSILAGPAPVTNTTGQDKVMQQFRRSGDKDSKRLATEHLSISIPKDTPREEIIEMAMQLLQVARKNHDHLLTA